MNVHESPGTRSRKIGSLSYNHEVEFTGNKVGETEDNMWAEIKYGDKTGWVKAMFLNTERPYGADNSKVEEASKSEKASAQTSSEAPKNDGARRYIGKNEVFLYESPTMASDVLRSGHLGEEVTFLGEKKKTNGFEWAKVSYNGKVGWVKADDLRIKMSTDTPHTVDLTDHDSLKKSFAKVKSPESGKIGDYDGYAGLQCVDLSRWFVDNFTTLKSAGGNGKDQVNNLIEANKIEGFADKTIPCAPAIYSIAANKLGPGLSNINSVTEYGHTGVILDVKRHYISDDPKKDKYTITYFHAWNGCNGYSSINTKDFYPSDDVTYLDLSNYMK